MATERGAAAGAASAAAGSPRRETPTFLFTDIEGSTRLLRRLGDTYAGVLDEHRALVSGAVTDNGGHVFGSEGDALFCAFPTPGGALEAAVAAQRALAGHAWPQGSELAVRMGIHTGEAIASGGNYVGLPLHEAARIAAAGHGGQVLVSEATRRVVSNLPKGIELRDLGERRFKDLGAAQRIYQVVGEGLRDGFAALRTLDTRANNLPVQLTSFVGRDELAAAQAALAETRLLSLTGPGGTGKTRLALQLAAAASDDFADGVYFVALDSTSEPELVPSVIAATLGLMPGNSSAPLESLADYLRGREMLLVLDNFEQIVDAAAMVSGLLREAPGLKVIVTTRVVLRVYGEREFPVPPLGLPPADVRPGNAREAAEYEAVRLFVERASAVQSQFMLTDENAPLIVDIVRRLDGLPLAIELAAARTRSLPVAAIRSRLDQHLSLLTGGARDLPGRQQTLRGAIDWSYDLLDAPDRRLFERFAVHAGGAFLTQADVVCGPADELGEDVLDGLTSLSEKSLVKSDLDADEDPRFAMLVTIRDYAHERLTHSEEFPELEKRHANTYLALVEQIGERVLARDGSHLADRLEQDHDNLRAALDWAVAKGEVEYALRFVVAIWRFWQTRGHLAEARRRVDEVMSMPGLAEQPTDLLARAYGAAGGIAYWQADVPQMHRYYKLGLEAAQATADERLVAEALYNLSFAPIDQDKVDDHLYELGKPLLEESLAIYERLADSRGVADTHWALSSAMAAVGDYQAAIGHARSALAQYRLLDDPFRIGWGLFLMASAEAKLGNLDAGVLALRESLSVFAAAGDRSGILLNLAGFAYAAAVTGDKERASRIGGAVETLRTATGAGLLDRPPDFIDFYIPERPVGDPGAERWWDEGTRLSTEEAVAYALGEADSAP